MFRNKFFVISIVRLKEGAPTWDSSDPDPQNPYHDRQVWDEWVVAEPWAENFRPVVPLWPDQPIVSIVPIA